MEHKNNFDKSTFTCYTDFASVEGRVGELLLKY